MNGATTQLRNKQAGAYLLEALIGILVFSFGILGIVGLQAQAIRVTNDAEFRAEAIYLANSFLSQMWTDNPTPAHLVATYDSTVGGPGYTTFATAVQTRFSGAYASPPIVKVNDLTDPNLPVAPSKTSSVVQVQVFWRVPGEAAGTVHNYTTTGVIGTN